MRGIGLLGLAANVVNGVVGVSIFTLPAAVALECGGAAPMAYLACAVIMAGVTACFAEAGSRVPTSGGAYGTVEAAFGPAAGFVTGMLLVVSDVLASGGVAAAIADLAGSVVPVLGVGFGRTGVMLAIYAALSWANLVGVRTTARLIAGATALKLAPLALFILLGVLSIGQVAPDGPPPTPITLAGFGRGLILTMFAFSGMECALGASGEVRDPARTLPRALFLGMVFVLALYLGVQLSAQHLLGTALAQEAAPLAAAAGRMSAPARLVMLAGGGLSMLAWMAGDVLGTSRMVFAMARDGRLPAWLGHLQPRSRVPARAVLVYVAAGFILAMTGSFLELVVLSSLAIVAVYILACAAAWMLRRRDVARAGTPLRVPGLGVAVGVSLLGMAGMIFSASRAEVGGLAALIAGSLGLYEIMRRVKTERSPMWPP